MKMMAAVVIAGAIAHRARRAGFQTPVARGRKANTHTVDAIHSMITGSGV